MQNSTLEMAFNGIEKEFKIRANTFLFYPIKSLA